MLYRHAAAEDALIVIGISIMQTLGVHQPLGNPNRQFRPLPEPRLSSPAFCTLGSRSRAPPNEGFSAEKGDFD